MTQVQHEVKRKERDAEKLRGRLRELMNERSRDARVALEAVGRFQDSARGRAKKSDEAMFQVRTRACDSGYCICCRVVFMTYTVSAAYCCSGATLGLPGGAVVSLALCFQESDGD